MKGIVAVRDIQPDNTVLSSRIAGAQIAYQGSGELAELQKQTGARECSISYGPSDMKKIIKFVSLNAPGIMLLVLIMVSGLQTALADRIKDLVSLGVPAQPANRIWLSSWSRRNGIGTRFPLRLRRKSTLERLGVKVDGPISNYDLFSRGVSNLAYDKTKLDNVASVIVTANLPFAKPGQKIDVNVGTAGSL